MATCYYTHPNDFHSLDNQQNCGPSTSGAQFCCSNGDTCLEDSIYHYTHPETYGSDYYIGGCTDSSYPEPCSKSCTDMPAQDIAFVDDFLSLWACCYQHPGANLNCSDPGDETFYAPSTQSLTRQAASSSTTSFLATSSTSSSSIPSSTSSGITSTSLTSSPVPPASISPPSAATTNARSSSLSAGSKAGIGVTASTVGLGIALLLGLYLLKKRRPKSYQEARDDERIGNAPPSPTLEQRQAQQISAEQRWELNGNARLELDGRGRSEMEARWNVGG